LLCQLSGVLSIWSGEIRRFVRERDVEIVLAQVGESKRKV